MAFTRTKEGVLIPLQRSEKEVADLLESRNIRFIDLQLTDLSGRLQHVTIPRDSFELDSFEQGVPKLDGSSIRGYTAIHESDMLLKPDPSTFGVIPWSPESLRTARMICDVYWGYGGGRFSRDPRGIAQKAEELIKASGFDLSYWGPEVEFFVFDSVTWDVLNSFRGQSYRVESKEAVWNSNGTNYPIRFKEGYYPVEPHDTLMNLRSEVVELLAKNFGVVSDAHHHEVATAGQCEIDMHYDTLTNMADSVMTYKYVVKNVAHQHGLIATVMPKPVFGDNASGMHVHTSLWKNGKNIFYDPDDAYAELSQTARYFGGGLMNHAQSLTAIVAPSTNSYRRLVPGFEAPVYVAWSIRNRSAAIRIPVYQKGPSTSSKKRIEFRPPDPSSNPYLCFAAIAAAGIDGIKKKIDMGDPVDEDIYKLSPIRRRELGIKELPGSLKEAVECLECDNEYLKPIFSSDAIEMIIEIEKKESLEVSMRPHPYEFHLYFDL